MEPNYIIHSQKNPIFTISHPTSLVMVRTTYAEFSPGLSFNYERTLQFRDLM